jgi:hypothetical protein
MSTNLKLNGLLSLPSNFDLTQLSVGKEFTIEKSGMRIMPFYNPMELSTADHIYLGKIIIKELRIIKDKTFITFEILKLFNEQEKETFTNNFIKNCQ